MNYVNHSSSIMLFMWVPVVMGNFGLLVDGQAGPCMGGVGVLGWCLGAWWFGVIIFISKIL